MKTTVELITPQMAEKYLSMNLINRPIKNSVVKRYAQDMREGRWSSTHQGIAFTEEGNLCDGQHRLMAVIMAQTPISFSVTRGVPSDALPNLDIGVKRTFHDSMSISGVTLSRDFSPALKGMFTLEIANTVTWPQHMASLSFMRDLADLCKDGVLFACDSCGVRGSGTRGIFSSPVMGPIARAYYSHDQDRLLDFVAILKSGLPVSPSEDMAAILLRNWKLANSTNGTKMRRETYLRTENALVSFLERKPLTLLRKRESEAFPLPEELNGKVQALLNGVRSSQ